MWDALNKEVERDASISNMIMRAKSPSKARTVLNSMIENEDSSMAKDRANINLE